MNKKDYKYIPAIVLGVIVVGFFGFFFYALLYTAVEPLLTYLFDPTYKQAEHYCDAVPFVTYEEILEQYKGHIYERTAYLNQESGDGMLDLNVEGKGDYSCRLKFTEGRVSSVEFNSSYTSF